MCVSVGIPESEVILPSKLRMQKRNSSDSIIVPSVPVSSVLALSTGPSGDSDIKSDDSCSRGEDMVMIKPEPE